MRLSARPFIAALVIVVCVAPPLLAQKAKGKANKEATAKLLSAAAGGEPDGILEALAAGADANGTDGDGNTPLILAAANQLWGKEQQVFDALAKSGAKLDGKNKEGVTPLMSASQNGRNDFAKLLIAAGANVNAKDKDGWTSLMYAAINGEWGVTDLLLPAKANLEAADGKGWTALLIALSEGKSSVAERLLKAGAKLPDKGPSGLSPLLETVFSHDLASVRLVLERKPDLTSRDKDGWTPLQVAAYNGDGQIAMDLLRAGADPAVKDPEGKTALDRAVENKRDELAAVLSGKWDPPAATGGTSLTVPCPALGGDVRARMAVQDGALVFTTTYPRPLVYYLGGGMTNRAKSSVKLTYDGSVAPTFWLDIDSNPRTGAKATAFEKDAGGSEFSLDYMEYGTTVRYSYRNSQGETVEKGIYANVLSVDLKKGDETVDTSGLDEAPDASNEDGVLVTRVPLTLLTAKPGKPIRVTAKVGSCGPVSASVKTK